MAMPQTTTVDALQQPFTLPNGSVLPNRLAKAALSESLARRDHTPGDRIKSLYRRWSQNGAGLVITGNVMVDRRAIGEPGNVVVEDDSAFADLVEWAEIIKSGGAKAWAQINHPGRQAPRTLTPQPVAPSAVALDGSAGMFAEPRALTGAEIEDIIRRFATTAGILVRAGFDGVQIHGAHGYLVSQFLSPLANRRTDEWGGTPEKRRRFVIEIARAIRAEIGPDAAMGIKLNSADFQRGGFSEEDSRAVVAALAHEDVDLIEVSGGNYESPAMGGSAADSTRAREAYFLDYARSVRREAGQVPIAVTGGFRSRSAMDEALAVGDCDVIGIARPTVTATDAAARILDGQETLETHEIQAGMRGILGRVTDLKALDGFLNISWSTDQLHRLARGLEPDLGRGALATTVAMVRRNGRVTLRPKRGVA